MMKITPFDVRSTLYMPATQGNLVQIITEKDKTNADAIVFCFEDALNILDIPKGIENLNTAFEQIDYDPVTGDIMAKGKVPYRFIRVRSIENYHQLMQSLSQKVIKNVHGIVIPKFTPSNIRDWEKALDGTSFYVMPTLETEDYYNPSIINELFSRLTVSPLRNRVLMLRLGGNDLLRGLAMKRPRMKEIPVKMEVLRSRGDSDKVQINVEMSKFKPTIYDTPLLSVINQVMIQARYSNFEVSAPVFENFDPRYLNSFVKEMIKDRFQGFIGKTAIHPSQCELINQFFSISEDDLQLAQSIVDDAAENGLNGGVSNKEKSMIEPTTHYAWASRLVSNK